MSERDELSDAECERLLTDNGWMQLDNFNELMRGFLRDAVRTTRAALSRAQEAEQSMASTPTQTASGPSQEGAVGSDATPPPEPPRVEPVPDGFVVAPNFRGYAALGEGGYLLVDTDAGEPAELIIYPATEEEKVGRVVGDSEPIEPGTEIPAERMAVRIRFLNEAGLRAFDAQMSSLRKTHFPSTINPPADVAGLVEALAELVACKQLKEDAQACHMTANSTAEYRQADEIMAEYKRRQPLAWEAARAALAAYRSKT